MLALILAIAFVCAVSYLVIKEIVEYYKLKKQLED